MPYIVFVRTLVFFCFFSPLILRRRILSDVSPSGVPFYKVFSLSFSQIIIIQGLPFWPLTYWLYCTPHCYSRLYRSRSTRLFSFLTPMHSLTRWCCLGHTNLDTTFSIVVKSAANKICHSLPYTQIFLSRFSSSFLISFQQNN